MDRFLKTCGYLVVMITISLCSCVHHKIDTDLLTSVEGRAFRVGKVQGQCRVPGARHGLYSADEQISLLRNVPVNDIVKVLRSGYGLNILEEDLSVKSRAAGLVGLFSETYERCAYLEGASYDAKGDVINVLFTVENSSENMFGYDLWYDISVESAGTTLIRHKDKVASFRQFGNTIWLTAMNLRKIPDVLRKDIQNSKKIAASKTAKPDSIVSRVPDGAVTGTASNPLADQTR
jgi:hypothetical protein